MVASGQLVIGPAIVRCLDGGMTRILVAPDKFKGSLVAVEVADAVRRGIAAYDSDVHVVCVPVADGGDGTLDAAVAAGFERVAVTATGPTGEPVRTAYAVKDGTAVVEMAMTSEQTQIRSSASSFKYPAMLWSLKMLTDPMTSVMSAVMMNRT